MAKPVPTYLLLNREKCRSFGIVRWNYPTNGKYLTLKTIIAFVGIVCSFAFTFTIRGYFKSTTAEPQTKFSLNPLNYQGAAESGEAALAYIKVPEDLDFAGESVPWQLQPVRQRYAREASGEAYWMMPSILLEQ